MFFTKKCFQLWNILVISLLLSAIICISPALADLKAPVPEGMTLTVATGYNTPLPGQPCNSGIGPGHCNNKKYGLDLQVNGSSTDILAPIQGHVAWRGNDCLDLHIRGTVNYINICHFSSFAVNQGDGIEQGDKLGTRSTSWIHLSIDDEAGPNPPGNPIPFSDNYTIEGVSFPPLGDSCYSQYANQNIVITSTNQKVTSLTSGMVVDDNGRLLQPPPYTSRNNNPVLTGEVRQAENYWGLKEIDDGGFRSNACPANAKSIYIVGAHGDEVAEYRVNFPSKHQTYLLTVVGMPDDPKPVNVDVYVDGSRVGQVKWNDSNPRCNEKENGNSLKLELTGYEGIHNVAFRFANDSYTCSGAQDDSCDRNFWFDYFKFEPLNVTNDLIGYARADETCPTQIVGWASSPDFSLNVTSVKVFDNNHFVGEGPANQFWDSTVGNHGFSIPLPGGLCGDHQVRVIAQDPTNSYERELIDSPITLICPADPQRDRNPLPLIRDDWEG